MYKYYIQIDGDPGFVLEVDEPIHTGDYVYYLNYTLSVLSKTFFIDEEGKSSVVLMCEDHIEEELDLDEEDEDDLLPSLSPEEDFGEFCVPHVSVD